MLRQPRNPSPSKTKRKRKRKEKDNSDKGSEDIAVLRSAVRPDKQNLACPFLRFDPIRYFACADCDLANYEAVKLHITRKHKGKSDFYCPICFSFFDDEDAKDEHVRRINGNTTCVAVPGHDKITNDEWERVFGDKIDKINRCPRTSDNAVKWLWLWRKFFDGHPEPLRESVYLQELAAEARILSLNLETIQSVLETHLPLNQPATPALARTIRDRLMLADSGPRRYRVLHSTNDVQDDKDQGSSVDSNRHLEPQSADTQVVESANVDAELLRPVTEQQASLSQGELPSSVVGGTTAQATTEGSDVPILQDGRSLSPAQVLPQLADPDVDNSELWRVVVAAPRVTVEDFWGNLRISPISTISPDGPKWGDVTECIDWMTWRETWSTVQAVPFVCVSIPIQRSHIRWFRAMESGGTVDPRTIGDFDGAGEFVWEEET